MYEGRFAKLFNPCTGVLTWMSNPAQPSFVWQIYSYDLEPNASFFAVKKACEAVHIQMNQNNFHVMVINHTPQRLEAMAARAAVYDMDGQLKAEQRMVVTAEPSAATDCGVIQWPTDLSPVHFVKLELRDRQGRLVSDNFYWRARPDREDEFTELEKMPTVSVDCRVDQHDDGDKCLLDVMLMNHSDAVALLAHIQLRRSSGPRVLPVYYGENYVSLLPGEQRSISVEAAMADLKGEEPAIAVDGWNVTTADRSFGNVTIAANKDAQVDSESRGIWTVLRQSASPTSNPTTRPLQSN
jgi:beta-mannosidase